MTYPMPTNLTRLSDLIPWAKDIVGNWLGIGILIALFFIVFSSSITKTEAGNAYTTAITITSFIAVLFMILGLIDGFVLMLCFALTGLGVWITSKSRKGF